MSTSNKVFLAAIIVGIVATVYLPQLLVFSLALIFVGIKLRRQKIRKRSPNFNLTTGDYELKSKT